MGLERIRLREPCMADITFVRFLTGVNAQMALQFERVGRCVRTVRTLERPFARVTAEVALQLAQLHTGVIAFGAFVRFLVGVLVADVAHHFAGRRETTVAMLALVRLRAGVRVDMILERCPCLEAVIADGALVRTILGMDSHVPGQQVAFGHRV